MDLNDKSHAPRRVSTATRAIAAGLGLLIASAGSAAATPPLSAQDRAALNARTAAAQPSSALIKALALMAPVANEQADGPASRASAEAALAALRALPSSPGFSAFDRAWIAYETAAALQVLGRDDEARSAYRSALDLPKTKVQYRRTLMALHALGDPQRPGRCPAGSWQTPPEATAPAYPPPAELRGIEGWVDVLADIHENGSVANLTTVSSSLAIFEPAAAQWMSSLRYRSADGAEPGRPCFAEHRVAFRMRNAALVQFPIEMVVADPAYSFRSIGAARAAAAVQAR